MRRGRPPPPARRIITEVLLGVDVGTSSSKGVLVSRDGRVLDSATIEHAVSRPRPGWAEMDAALWWDEFVVLAASLSKVENTTIVGVGVSGIGPCVLVTDHNDRPLRPAILYGIDVRATEQIARLTKELGGSEAITAVCGSALSSQAVGPKLAWIADNEPDTASRARRLYMPSSWLVRNLTGAHVLDMHSASQSTPLFDSRTETWHDAWWDRVAPQIERPSLLWPGAIAGIVSPAAARATGIPEGAPVITGTIDAWAEAVSVGATEPGDLMLMYGTTMFLINTVGDRVTGPPLWGTVGVRPGTRNLAAGMAASGAVTAWLRDLFGAPGYSELLTEAARAPAGAHGLVMLPYFAGERTPIDDPAARGLIAGLTLSHTRGDVYRAALEATAFGVRHNVEAMTAAGGDVRRVVAVGGGTRGALWTQIVSDVTGLEQEVPRVTIGASYGSAYLAAEATGEADIDQWNPRIEIVQPRPERHAHDRLYRIYRSLYDANRSTLQELAAIGASMGADA